MLPPLQLLRVERRTSSDEQIHLDRRGPVKHVHARVRPNRAHDRTVVDLGLPPIKGL